MALERTVRIVVNTKEAISSLRRFGFYTKDADKSTSALSSSVGKLATSFAGVISVGAGVRKLVSVTREFDTINASLVTATGSAENAAEAFEAIQRFAATTPFALQEVANGFVKLRNLGLEPSERALRSYGNTASALGKSLDQFIEAVADAATAEFERLKEFGIRAKNEGDSIAFTFQGVTKRVANNSQEIQKFLLELGETEFSGAIEQRAKTLDGAISNLGDSWNQLFLTVSQQGVGEAITKSIRGVTEVINSAIQSIASGQLAGIVDAYAAQFRSVFSTIGEGFTLIAEIANSSFSSVADSGESLSAFLIDSFKQLPANITAFVQIITVELAALVDKAIAFGGNIAAAINPANWFNDDDVSSLESDLARIDKARIDTISGILSENRRVTGEFEESIIDSNKLLEDFKNKSIESTGDALKKFGIDVKNTGKSYTELASEINPLIKIALNYKKVVDDINGSTATSAQKAELLSIAQRKLTADFKKVNDSLKDQDDSLRGLQEGFEDYAKDATDASDELAQSAIGTAKSIEDAFVEMATTGKLEFSDLVNSILADIARIQVRKNITGPLSQALGESDILGSIAGFFGFGADANAKGGAYDGGVKKYARGGIPSLSDYSNSIVSSPTMFATGAGLMGEAGPEAILPLTRTSSGNLGVESSGMGGVKINIINQSSGEVKQESITQRRGPNGETIIDAMIVDSVKKAVGEGRLDKTFNTAYGIRRQGT